MTREMLILTLAIGWILTVFVGLLAALIIREILRGRIQLAFLISGPNGDASLSRFQFLIFTFVIALSLFLIIVSHPGGPGFPDKDIPVGILALLGISGGSYVVSKGIDASGQAPAPNPPQANPPPPAP